MTITLKELGRQTQAECDNLKSLCDRCLARKREAMRTKKPEEAARNDQLYKLHMEQYTELCKQAAHLLHYYETDSPNKNRDSASSQGGSGE
jgi:hypothetical protein